MNAQMPGWMPLRQEPQEEVRTAAWYRQQDYRAGWDMGRRGEPDPRNVNFQTWLGWRDAAARYGYLEPIDVFRNRP